MPRTGTTLCHPKKGYVDLSVIPLSTHKLSIHLWATLMETNTRLLSTRRTKTMVTPKHNPSHVRRHTLPSQPSQLLMTQFCLNTHNLSRVLQHQKQTQIFHAANKTLCQKYLSTIAILLLHHPPFISYKLSEGTNNTKRGKQLNVNTHTLQPSLATYKPTFIR